jgi:hypothetical protein
VQRIHAERKHRTRLVCRLHAPLAELAPGGIAKEMNAFDADRLLAGCSPAPPSSQAATNSPSNCSTTSGASTPSCKRRTGGSASRCAPRGRRSPSFRGRAARRLHLVGHTGDVGRFRNADQFAAYNGTAPAELSSGGRTVHRLSQRGNRQLNHALHLAALCQLR